MEVMGNRRCIKGTLPECGAIFMSNRETMEECLRRKLFGLPFSKAGFVEHVKEGMFLFLFEYESRELHGVFQACSDGAIDIVPWAFSSTGKYFSAQVCVTTIWNCSPLSEHEFHDAIQDNYFQEYKFNFGLSEDQVHRLLLLFSSKRLKDLQPWGQLRSTKASKPTRSSLNRVRKLDDSGFLADHRVENEHEVDNDFGLVTSTEHPRNSLSEISRLSDEGRFAVSDQGKHQHCLDRDIGQFLSTENFGSSLDKVIEIPDDGRFMMGDRVGNEHSMDNDQMPNLTTEYREKSLGKERKASYDARYSAGDSDGNECHVDGDLGWMIQYAGNSLKLPNDDRFEMSSRSGNRHDVVDNDLGPVMSVDSPGNSLRKVRREPDPCRFMASNKIENESNFNYELGPVISTEIPINPMCKTRRVADDDVYAVSNRVTNEHKDLGFPIWSEHHGRCLGEVGRVADKSRFTMCHWVGSEHRIDNDVGLNHYLYKPNLNLLDYSSKKITETDNSLPQPYINNSAFYLREPGTSHDDTIAPSTDPCKAGVSTMCYSGLPSLGLYHSSNSVQQSLPSSSLGNVFGSSKDESVAFHTESRGVTRCLDDVSGFGNCLPSPTPNDYEYSHYRTTIPFSGRAYSESNAVEYSDIEGYRSKSLGKSPSVVPLSNGENVGPAPHFLKPSKPYFFRSDEEAPSVYDYGYPDAGKYEQPQHGGDKNEGQHLSDFDFKDNKYGTMYSTRQKGRTSVFSRLSFATEAGAQEDGSHVDHDDKYNVDSSVEELMDMLHNKSCHWVKKERNSNSRPLSRLHDHDNDDNFRNKRVKSFCSEIEGKQSALDNKKDDWKRAEEKPIVNFKRRSEMGKNKNETKTKGSVESSGNGSLLGAQTKRRKLIRPDFSKKESYHEEDTVGENSPDLPISSQESVARKDENTGSCKALMRKHENENKINQNDCKVIYTDADDSDIKVETKEESGGPGDPCLKNEGVKRENENKVDQNGWEGINTDAGCSDSKVEIKEEPGGPSLTNESELLLVTCRDEFVKEKSIMEPMADQSSWDHLAESCTLLQCGRAISETCDAGSVKGMEKGSNKNYESRAGKEDDGKEYKKESASRC